MPVRPVFSQRVTKFSGIAVPKLQCAGSVSPSSMPGFATRFAAGSGGSPTTVISTAQAAQATVSASVAASALIVYASPIDDYGTCQFASPRVRSSTSLEDPHPLAANRRAV